MPNPANSGPETPSERPEDALAVASDAAEASEKAARGAHLDATAAPAPLAPLGVGLGSAAPRAPGPSDPKRRSSGDPGNRAEASDRDAAGNGTNA